MDSDNCKTSRLQLCSNSKKIDLGEGSETLDVININVWNVSFFFEHNIFSLKWLISLVNTFWLKLSKSIARDDLFDSDETRN